MGLLADRVSRAQCQNTEPKLGQPVNNKQDSVLSQVLGTNLRSYAGIYLKGPSKIMKTHNLDNVSQ
jgi:hypothetical protein